MKKIFSLKNFTFVIIFAFALFAVSCDKYDDGILPNNSEDAQLKAGKAVKKGDMSIAEIAINQGFDSLVVALSYVDSELETGLVDMFLNGTDQYTVFAPTNDAFVALVGNGEISDLPADLVLDVLLYHVTEGRRATNSVVPKKNIRNIETLLGVPFTVDTTPMIHAVGNTANFVKDSEDNLLVNISASNGIIHVIDAVILPVEL
jgi:transforming growth factor-beta-induced protein